VKTILPGATIGLLGEGENSRMFTAAAERMGYRVHVRPYDHLAGVRDFASGVDVLTVVSQDVPSIGLRAAEGVCLVRPGSKTFEAIENGIGAKRDASQTVIADFYVIAARGADGAFAYYPPIAVDRVEGVLDIARSPAPIDSRMAKRAAGLTRDIFEDLDLIGLACVEFTLTHEHQLLIHDVTPHPHPAGNLTIEACVTDQFEQQLRAVCGLPLGSTEMIRPAAMAVVNWDEGDSEGEPDWAAACALPGVKLHLYGARSGHLTATAASATLAKQIVRAACNALRITL
jgi:phosphoribosylaminoimidazole carboxylase (NCAIR synthetase)